MKELNQYISEKLIVNNTIEAYNYHPTSFKILIKCIKEKIDKEGLGTKDNPLNLNDIDTSKITSMAYLFCAGEYDNLKELSENGYFDISKWDVSNVEYMYSMFYGSNFNGDISKWNVSKVTDMSYMFNRSRFNGDLSDWNVSNVESMYGMFRSSKFTGKNGDISKWNVSNVKNMFIMFYDSSFDGDISNWNVSNVENMDSMFTNCPLQYNPPKWYKERFSHFS